MTKTGELRIGTSGYQYKHWRGPFYPDDLPKRRWLSHYAEAFSTVELNSTFYGLPSPDKVAGWTDEVPRDFHFALKFSRYGSHTKRLKDPENIIPPFQTVADAFGERLGPILLQLPPRWRADAPRLDAFLTAAPPRLRWAVELRDSRWLTDTVFETLSRHGAALCVHDLIADHPELATTDWVYRRFHGPENGDGYSDQDLETAAEWLNEQRRQGRNAWVFFNNDQGGHAVIDARRLAQLCCGNAVSDG